MVIQDHRRRELWDSLKACVERAQMLEAGVEAVEGHRWMEVVTGLKVEALLTVGLDIVQVGRGREQVLCGIFVYVVFRLLWLLKS